jgi:hypothetical protein
MIRRRTTGMELDWNRRQPECEEIRITSIDAHSEG